MNQIFSLQSGLEKRPFVSALMIVAIAFGGMLSLIIPVFDTSDDMYMKGIVSGTFCVAEASDLMVYSNVLIGCLLKAAYAWSPGFPWYAFYLLATHFVAYVALLWAFILIRPTWQTVGYFLMAMLGFGSHLLWHLSFTTTAFLAVQSGIVLLIVQGCTSTREVAVTIARMSCGVLLIALGSMIRWQMFLCVSLLSIPLIASAFLLCRSRKRAVRGTVMMCVTAGLCIALATYDEAAYLSDPSWGEFHRINTYVYWVVDLARPVAWTTHPLEVQEILQGVGWSPNDVRMAQAWFLIDREVYTADALREVGSAWLQLQSSSSKLVLAFVIAMCWIHLSSLWGIAAIAASLPRGFQSGARVLILGCAGSWAITICTMGWLAITQKLPERVALPMIACATASTLLLKVISGTGDRMLTNGLAKWWGRGLVGIMLVTMIMSLEAGFRHQGHLLKEHSQFLSDLDQVAGRRNNLVVLWTPFPYGLLLPYDDLRRLDRFPKCVLGAIERSPHAAKQLAKLGITDVMSTIAKAQSVSVIAGPEHLMLLKQFIKEHHHTTLDFKLAFRAQAGFGVYECVARTQQPVAR
jgi:hypothetical protein